MMATRYARRNRSGERGRLAQITLLPITDRISRLIETKVLKHCWLFFNAAVDHHVHRRVITPTLALK
jgi:hypothetical protein